MVSLTDSVAQRLLTSIQLEVIELAEPRTELHAPQASLVHELR